MLRLLHLAFDRSSERGGTSAVTIDRDGSADGVCTAVPPSLPPALSTQLKPALHLHSRAAGEMNVLIEITNG